MLIFDDNNWRQVGNRNGWTMPVAPWWKCLPIIRHMRGVIGALRMKRLQKLARASDIEIGGQCKFEIWVNYGIWRGLDTNDRTGL